VSKPAISQHLRVLEETGVLRRTIEGRTHRLWIQPGVLSVAADWMDRRRASWGRLFGVVDE
jgi:DNA-binding transcriptional ArsR family regulator